MSIDPITAASVVSATQNGAVSAAPASNAGAFSAVLDGVQGLNEQMHANDRAIQLLALGETDNLHQVMMNMERTKLAFDLALQIRNKALEAYQELMRMQV